MRTMFGGFAAAASAGALALAMPAGATVSVDSFATYGFQLAGTSYTSTSGGFKFGSTSAAGTSGSSGVGSSSLGVTASAWNINATTSNSVTTYAVTKPANGLVQYDGGLGITSAYDTLGSTYNIAGLKADGTTSNSDNSANYLTDVSCAQAGSCLTHQIDNQGNGVNTKSMDVIQLVFDRAVILNTVGTTAFGLVSGATVSYGGKTYNKLAYDDDFSYGNGNPVGGVGTGLATTSSMNSTTYNNLWDGFVGDNGECSVNATVNGLGVCSATATANAAGNKSLASNVWYISAGAALSPQAGSDAIADAFKLNNITVFEYVKTLMFAPEPGTWMMMVLGFGAIGTSIRRRKAEERKALAA